MRIFFGYECRGCGKIFRVDYPSCPYCGSALSELCSALNTGADHG
jgi:rRNA maturation endonuclease Nob1